MLTKDENGQYFYDGQRVLVRYIRGDFRQVPNPRYRNNDELESQDIIEYYPGPVGVMIAAKIDGEIRYGYSKANTNKGDKFDKKKGLNIAFGRIMKNNIQPPFDGCAKLILPDLQYMQKRAERYFNKS